MKTPKGLMIIIFISMFSVSCAGVSQIPFKTMIEEADSRVGESVILGGYIIDSNIVPVRVSKSRAVNYAYGGNMNIILR
jgi:hypothetical protein